MLPTINGKSFLECTEEDLKELLGNSAYRENEHIDYKSAFAINSYPKGEKRDAEIAELRSDICSFANADGGYLIFGIQEDGQCIAKELVGIEVKNKDRFELDLNNWLQSIVPRIPTYKIRFIDLNSGKHVVVLSIDHDFFAPYIHLEGERNYRIYRRVGNSKKIISYMELKNMFMQSMVLEKEIGRFREERVDFFCLNTTGAGEKTPPFLLLHIIPEILKKFPK